MIVKDKAGEMIPRCRHRACKVCSILRADEEVRGKQQNGTAHNARMATKDYLCIQTRQQGNSCFDVWHDDWHAGQSLPASNARKIQRRRAIFVGDASTNEASGSAIRFVVTFEE
ncbi:TPA: hypothetical protein N0F65_012762 [Lagenidium giganteum]|uniref:Uncharacterized protein n=1 Tax=Lagenidium giganteum TaxID=4803 RepID=A0AAV2YGI1_9STRA|nr:TPA: hypothetical protein N0F65_012762 [Lagenidium giganteum]